MLCAYININICVYICNIAPITLKKCKGQAYLFFKYTLIYIEAI